MPPRNAAAEQRLQRVALARTRANELLNHLREVAALAVPANFGSTKAPPLGGNPMTVPATVPPNNSTISSLATGFGSNIWLGYMGEYFAFQALSAAFPSECEINWVSGNGMSGGFYPRPPERLVDFVVVSRRVRCVLHVFLCLQFQVQTVCNFKFRLCLQFQVQTSKFGVLRILDESGCMLVVQDDSAGWLTGHPNCVALIEVAATAGQENAGNILMTPTQVTLALELSREGWGTFRK